MPSDVPSRRTGMPTLLPRCRPKCNPGPLSNAVSSTRLDDEKTNAPARPKPPGAGHGEATSMSKESSQPRRVRVAPGIYYRALPRGRRRYEFTYTDSDGRQQWQVVNGGLAVA